MDNLEEYIMKHREELDRRNPSSGVWRKIRKELKTGRIPGWISIAAMIAVVLGTALLFLKPAYRAERSGDPNSFQALMKNNTQLRETEIYYNNLANTIYGEVNPMLAKNPEIRKELFSDISQIDSICSEIKKDLKDNVDNQDVIEALIQNYRIKISMLEDMLKMLKENDGNADKKKSHEL